MLIVIAPSNYIARLYVQNLDMPRNQVKIVLDHQKLRGYDLRDVPVHFVMEGWGFRSRADMYDMIENRGGQITEVHI